MDEHVIAGQQNPTGRNPHAKRVPTESEPGSMENRNVTGPASVDQPTGAPARPQPEGLEKQNVTQPAPPK